MRVLLQEEIDQVSGGIDSLKLGPVSITGVEAGLALRSVMGSFGAAFAFGYGIGSVLNAGWTGISGDTLGNQLYRSGH